MHKGNKRRILAYEKIFSMSNSQKAVLLSVDISNQCRWKVFDEVLLIISPSNTEQCHKFSQKNFTTNRSSAKKFR